MTVIGVLLDKAAVQLPEDWRRIPLGEFERQVLHQSREALGPIMSIPAVEAHLRAVLDDLQAVAVELRLVQPCATSGRLLGRDGTTGANEGEHVAGIPATLTSISSGVTAPSPSSHSRRMQLGAVATYGRRCFITSASAARISWRTIISSNVESAFSMIKAKFRDNVRSKTPGAMVNEVLCKLICHNICVLIQEAHELGIEVKFQGTRRAQHSP